MEPERTTPPRTSLLRNPYVWALLLLALAMLTLARSVLRRQPAAPPVLSQVPAFELVDASGRAFGSADLAGRVYVANFIFTRCASVCPLLTAAMARLQERYAAQGVEAVHLVSVSVDPEFDTPEVLSRYGRLHGVDPARWTLLTGDREAIAQLMLEGFKLGLGEATEPQPGLIDIAHSGKLVLVDGTGRVRGYYDIDDVGLDGAFQASLDIVREQRR